MLRLPSMPMPLHRLWPALALAGMLLWAACDAGPTADGPPHAATPADAGCIIPSSQFADGGVGKDGIPALTDPPLVAAAEASYLRPEDRVIGLVVDGQAVAVPHNVLWFHEIANFDFATAQLAITYCPLTGSSLAFDRRVVGGATFGVSGLLFQNNLTLYDRTSRESLWPQMFQRAGCGPRLGARLSAVPVQEITWAGWQALHPATRVVSENTGFDRNYTAANYPYGNYEDPNSDVLLFNMPIDGRRPPKERLLGLSDGRQGGLAFPFSALDDGAPANAVHATTADGVAVVVLWDRAYRSAMAFHPSVEGRRLAFEVRDGRIVDVETGSTWRVDGLATGGPRAGQRLEPIGDAYVAFWFAWAAFHPETMIWQRP